MKKQIMNRLGVAHVRDTVMQFSEGAIKAEQALSELGVGKSRLYQLRTEFLAARAAGMGGAWVPGTSGGDHTRGWPEEVEGFLQRVLSRGRNSERYSYAFAASEVGRRFGFVVDRGQVRHWALEHGIKNFLERPRVTPHVRRWQRTNVGELWQLDATPDYFFGRDCAQFHLLDMVDDCSRMQVGCQLYAKENTEAYIHLFYKAFMRYGLPLEIYVDKASFFRAQDGMDTQLARRLRHYGISFLFANSPAAKGKIERVHQVWQDRLPRYFNNEGIGAGGDLCEANAHLDRLVDYRNGYERHSEIRMTPRKAWDDAIAAGRTKLRPVPQDGWWELVWSMWSSTVVGPSGKVVFDGIWRPTGRPCGSRAFLCRHVDGTFSLVLNKPEHGVAPRVVFTTNPRVNRI